MPTLLNNTGVSSCKLKLKLADGCLSIAICAPNAPDGAATEVIKMNAAETWDFKHLLNKITELHADQAPQFSRVRNAKRF